MIVFLISIGIGAVINLVWMYASFGNYPTWIAGGSTGGVIVVFGIITKILTLKEIDAFESSR